MQYCKVLVIGIDGACFDVIKPWIDDGSLPNMKYLMENGRFGLSESVILPASPSAWASFSTGKTPGKHGVFGYTYREPETYDFRIMRYDNKKSEDIYGILSKHHKKVCVVNVPFTYPPEKVNGIFISGLLGAPSGIKEAIHPKELCARLKKQIKHLDRYLQPYSGSHDKYIKDLKNIIGTRIKLNLFLLENCKWDLFVTVFDESDLMHHVAWKGLDVRHPEYCRSISKKYGNLIKETYIEIDKGIGEILRKTDKNTTVFVVSDHGFGLKYDLPFPLNLWLEKKGYLKIKGKPKNALFRLGMTKNRFRELLDKIHITNALRKIIPEDVRGRIPNDYASNDIDWDKTKAFSLGGSRFVYFNVKGKYPRGIVSEGEYPALISKIKKDLLDIKNYRGEEIVKEVYDLKKLYDCDDSVTENLPDLVVLLKEIPTEYVGDKIGKEKNLFKKEVTPEHHLNGMYIAYGRNINKAKNCANIRLIDLAPTILHILGIPIPKDMDGKVLTDTFKKKRKIKYEKLDKTKIEKERVNELIKNIKF